MRFADLLPDAREDVTQSALERIFKSFNRCREPIAFLAFAAQHLLDAVRVVRRQEHRAVQSLAQPSGQSDEALADVLQDDKPQPDEHIIAEEQRTAIEKLLLEYSQMHPRATQQIAVLRMKWIDDLDEGEIGQRLGISINSVYVAQSRIAKTMRSEPHWRARAVALGILLDEL
jgi:RNA polymerase sigma factor (sigma-70 family)